MNAPGLQNLTPEELARLEANTKFQQLVAGAPASQKGIGIEHLIWWAKTHPPKPVISNLLHEGEIAGLHGAPEVFKTIFSMQFALSLATGKPFLGVWQVPKRRRVYFFETEMSVLAMGKRLGQMYDGLEAPRGIYFADEAELKKFRRASDLQEKFCLLGEWVKEVEAEVLVIDTANPFFRGKQSPNDETTAGAFFDLLAELPGLVKVFVRHNHKPRIDDTNGDAAAKMRGSGQFSDVPDLLMELSRADKRTNEASLSVTKFRHGSRPDNLTIWLDSETLRLVSVPPVIDVLKHGPLTRTKLLAALDRRFGIKQRKADDLVRAELVKPDGEPVCLVESKRGHERVLEIDWDAAPNSEWFSRVGGITDKGRR
jgi:hypothetical protein